MALIVYTAHMSRSWKEDPDALDVTIKSSRGVGAVFAPDNWEMVMGVKRGTVPPAVYRDWYLRVLRRSYRQERAQWEAVLARTRAVLLCYCHPEQFCHRQILAEVLTKLGADYRGEILPAGQLVPPTARGNQAAATP
jgi:hypothetical protein